MSFLSRPNRGRHLVLRPSLGKRRAGGVSPLSSPKKARGPIPDPTPPHETEELPLPDGPCTAWPGDDTVISAAVGPADWPDWTDDCVWTLRRNGCPHRKEVSDARV